MDNLLNKVSAYESLQKQDTEHRKLIKELQKENRDLIKEKISFGYKLNKITMLLSEGRDKDAFDLVFVYSALQAVEVELLKRGLKPDNKT